jgi:hypothetical protein
MHSANALGRRKAQLLNQQRQIDSVFLGCFNPAAWLRVPQSLFGSGKFLWSERT